ncbi:MAG: Type 1 glutamine amidotransferase-like domain-containing protein [Candidatus Moranbacteria bacterium]|nr:Type 1 glutamine amidotransferase-like domain-containing protein [Candidatus Moranbacteria bacterium]
MKLLLTSVGLSNKSIVNALAGLVEKPFSECSLAFVPTAVNVENFDKSWVVNDLVVCKALGFALLDIVDISALPKEMWLSRLNKADILFFEGGNTFHLMHWVKKSGLKDVLPEFLKTKVYVGVSVGSVIVCLHLCMSTSKKLYDEDGSQYANDGFGYLDFLIRPHLNSPYFPEVTMENMVGLSEEMSDSFYVIDDATAIQVIDGKVDVISEGVWKKFH